MNDRFHSRLTRRTSPEIRLIQRIRRQYLQVFAFTGAAITGIFSIQRWLGGDTGSALYLLTIACVYLSNFGLKGLGMSYVRRVNLLMLATVFVVFGDAYYLWPITPISMVWAVVIPFLGFVLLTRQLAVFWTITATLLMALTPLAVKLMPWQMEMDASSLAYHNITEPVATLLVLQILFMMHTRTIELVSRSVRNRQRRVEAMRDELLRSQRYKDRFFASISHELRTPMNAINGISGLLADKIRDEQERELVNSLRTASSHLVSVINDLLDLSRLQEGKIRFISVDFPLAVSLRSAWSIVRMAAQEKRIDYRLEIDPALPAYVRGDPHRLTQIVVNLLGNAVKFTDEGYISMAVRALPPNPSHGGQVNIEIAIQDTGIGIPDSFRSQVFQGFTQADNALTRTGGTGLGLYITRQLVTLQHGRVDFVSQEDIGTTFTAVLPYLLGSPPVDENSAPTPLETPAALRILLVDDNRMNLMVARLQLEKKIEGVQIHMVEDGQAAVEWLTDNDVDLVLMDLHMPRLDGIAATEYLRASPEQRLQQLPIIAMTANTFDMEGERCKAVGMNGFVAKPFDIEQLMREINRVLDKT
jgi:signal transduction histidine kinase/CheY-like chemotaxis protein